VNTRLAKASAWNIRTRMSTTCNHGTRHSARIATLPAATALLAPAISVHLRTRGPAPGLDARSSAAPDCRILAIRKDASLEPPTCALGVAAPAVAQ